MRSGRRRFVVHAAPARGAHAPQSAEDCFRILTDRGVRMNFTAQDMVLRAGTSDLQVRLPELPEA
ncbi:MAG: hypothetical protein JSW67_01585 [Candidatus Latescibacterota bacterium]|nr:MAG: hypothetical protein JSW67_01585 [Candidatus Latescibacterota bacterium]